MKSPKQISIIKVIAAMLIVVLVLISALSIISNVNAINTAKDKISDGLLEALTLYSDNLKGDISSIEGYLIGKAFDSSATNLRIIENGKDGTMLYSAIYKEKAELTSMMSALKTLDGLFIIPKQNQHFIYASKVNDNDFISPLRTILKAEVSDGTITKRQSNKWNVILISGKFHLVRVLNIGKSYVGAWISFTTLLSSLNHHRDLVDEVVFIDGLGNAYDSNSCKNSFSIDPSHTSSSYTLHKENGAVSLCISTPTNYISDSSSIAMLIPDEKISALLIQNYIIIVVICCFLVLVMTISLTIFRQYIFQPIRKLTSSINSLREGNFSVRINDNVAFSEFDNINSAFNDMVEKIEDLKISVYEKQINQQKYENKFLKTQIAPHFLINCLNLMYHLSESGENEAIQRVAVTLGTHLRYALSDRSETSLNQEFLMAKNYIELSNLRFFESISPFMSIDNDIIDAAVLPMVVVIFVENTIKYEVVTGEITEIHISASKIRKNEKDYVRLVMWDTGDGYSNDILEILQSGSSLSNEEGHHIGLRNMLQRFQIVYKDDFILHYSNREGAGAQLEIEYPYTKYTEDKDGSLQT